LANGVSAFFMEKETRTFDLTEIRATDGPKPVLEGHAAVFNQRSHDIGFREIILPGAFADAVITDDVKFLVNHRGLPLARTKSGTLKLSEDQKGLAFRAELDADDPDARRLLPKVKRGDISEMSFAFAVKDRKKDERWTYDNGEAVRSLLKVSLYDVSAVNDPAFPGTDLNTRSYFESRMREARAASLPDADDFRKAVDHFLLRRICDLNYAELLKLWEQKRS
jgi:HK97 family phage prohead protease